MSTKVIVNTETRVWSTRAADPTDRWDQGDSAGEVTNVSASITERERADGWGDDYLIKEFEEDIPPGTPLFTVVADYSSGSTFGRSGGYAQVLDVFTSKDEAIALGQAAKTSGERDYEFFYEGKNYHRSWVGFFERLQSLDVWQVFLRPRSNVPVKRNPEDDIGFRQGR